MRCNQSITGWSGGWLNNLSVYHKYAKSARGWCIVHYWLDSSEFPHAKLRSAWQYDWDGRMQWKFLSASSIDHVTLLIMSNIKESGYENHAHDAARRWNFWKNSVKEEEINFSCKSPEWFYFRLNRILYKSKNDFIFSLF